MKHKFLKFLAPAYVAVAVAMLSSCTGSRSYLVIPHAVSTASAVSVDNLNLSKGDYDVLNTITETASVICEYKNNRIKVTSGENDFEYIFTQGKDGWTLSAFSGAASLGYFTSDLQYHVAEVPDGEEFSRRVAMARIIRATKDYNADGVVEPVVISRVNNIGKNKVEFISTVSAKLISIKTTR